MSTTFICRHCKKRVKRNPRLKVSQHYCGSTACQQARKNEWERNRLRTSADYRARRQASKRLWYKNRPGHSYQHQYRGLHPDYVSGNRLQQQNRNKSRTQSAAAVQIVKTDVLLSKFLSGSGFHVILPVKNESVIKDCKDGRVNRATNGYSIFCSDITEQVALIVKTDTIASLIG